MHLRTARTTGSLLNLALLGLLIGCGADTPSIAPPTAPALDRAGYDVPGAHRQYGVPTKVGEGMARTYVVLDEKHGRAPLELGIALDDRALSGLPTEPGEFSFTLPLPTHAPEPYRFAELDWNPQGHEPEGVYSVPHFDFHFYTISVAERDAIVPSDPAFAAKARNVPTGDYVPPFYVVPGDPAALAVPRMGVHWLDVRSPELQGLLGNPDGYRPFTATFIYGSWDGRFTFLEPMVTRAFLLSNPDVTMPVSTPARYAAPGYYPGAYHVVHDAQAHEYRIALTDFHPGGN